jgi:triacylglycerol lipase
MAPGNAFLRDLERDADPWGAVEVHTVWTPFDAMIVPPRSSVLPGAASDTQLPILIHRWVPNDPRTIAHVVRVLTA